MRSYQAGWALALMVAGFGCGDDGDDGEAGGGLQLQFVAGGALEQALTVGEGDSAVDVARLELQIREFKALTDSSGSSDDGAGGSDDDSAADGGNVKVKGEYLIDVLDSTRNTIQIELGAEVYKKIEFKVDKPDNDEGIDGSGAALWFEGEKGGVRFIYRDDRMEKITLRHVDGGALADGGSGTLLANLDVASWLDGVDLEDLPQNADGVVEIVDDGDTKKAHDRIEDNIKDAIKLARKP